MSVSKRWVSDPKNQEKVLALYRDTRLLSQEAVAKELGTTMHNVHHVLKMRMSQAERDAHSSLRKSVGKLGSKNPMKGKTGSKHHLWKGECQDGHGYLTCLHEGKRQFVHRLVMAKALGLKTLPRRFDVHHINEDRMDNRLDNLALVTRGGHRTIHFLQVKDSVSLALKRSTLAEVLKSMTSQ